MRIVGDQTSIANAELDQVAQGPVDFIAPGDDGGAIIRTQGVDIRGDAADAGLAIHPLNVAEEQDPKLVQAGSLEFIGYLGCLIAEIERYHVAVEQYFLLVGNIIVQGALGYAETFGKFIQRRIVEPAARYDARRFAKYRVPLEAMQLFAGSECVSPFGQDRFPFRYLNTTVHRRPGHNSSSLPAMLPKNPAGTASNRLFVIDARDLRSEHSVSYCDCNGGYRSDIR